MARARILADSALSLAHFINRAQILQQYRTLLKTVAQLDPGATRDELAASVRSSFRKHQHEKDATAIAKLIEEGKKQQEALTMLVDTAVSTPPPPAPEWGDENAEWGAVGTG